MPKITVFKLINVIPEISIFALTKKVPDLTWTALQKIRLFYNLPTKPIQMTESQSEMNHILSWLVHLLLSNGVTKCG